MAGLKRNYVYLKRYKVDILKTYLQNASKLRKDYNKNVEEEEAKIKN